MDSGLELKFSGGRPALRDGVVIEGYASRFGLPDQGGDIVAPGAFAASLAKLAARGDKVRMLWQHDPAKPIGVWDEIREDETGLFVRGRLLEGVTLAQEAATLIEAGAIDGLSIGYRTIRAEKDGKGCRVLREVELWEVSLVTFPMLPEAKLGRKGERPEDIAAALIAATKALRG
ncbi:HK97 family phage prohead protease [Paracoccus albus]|uniref:HK97 family phage prohead protease n=1 Tax=Paracoccus albus TaxID=3017784 RepID=UPI0022F072DF|nr:HK97 family phage prohead protease [Paracoccus albus]WBU61818.1 HK97 family phage prohead protease [Paracoccus albus]